MKILYFLNIEIGRLKLHLKYRHHMLPIQLMVKRYTTTRRTGSSTFQNNIRMNEGMLSV